MKATEGALPTRDSNPATVALEARGVEKRFGEVQALAGVSVRVASGECLALVGESGSGKTTLLRTFNRMVEPDGGEVLVGGRSARALHAVRLRRETGYVPQEGGLLPHWSVLRNAALVPWLLGIPDPEAKARDALERVGLPPGVYGPRWPRDLSGGERQRVAIARAIASRPAVILLDEPFGALDAITRAEVRRHFVALRQELATTTVLVTHDLHEALELADRVAVLREGRLEQLAPPEELLAQPATPYVGRLLSQAGLTSASAPEAAKRDHGEGAPGDGDPQEGAPGDGDPQEGAPGDDGLREGAPGDDGPRKGDPGHDDLRGEGER